MLYLAATGSDLDALDAHPRLGVMTGPRTGGIHGVRSGRPWASDCDAFKQDCDEDAFLAHLERLLPWRRTCLFVTVPDVYADAESTLAVYEHHARDLALLAYPLAYVLQDGAHHHDFPPCQWVFLGGTDDYREAYGALLIERARQAGLRVHVGRVNSKRRLEALAVLDADAADGTHLAYCGVEKGVKKMGGWLESANAPKLFQASDVRAMPLSEERVRVMRAARGRARRVTLGAPDPHEVGLFSVLDER